MENSQQYQKSTATEQIERMTSENIPWYRKRLFREHQMRYHFASHYTKSKTILDIACGNGFGSHILAQTGAKKIYAIDNNPSAIDFATKQYQQKQITFSIGDAEEIELEDRSIDMVISFETIEHLKKPEACINEFKRVLKLKGTLILSTPNKEFSHGDNPFHIKEFTYEELSTLLSGFKQITFFGQRLVNKKAFNLYKKMENKMPFAKKFFRFRPWEKIIIEPISNPKKSDYLYFIAICTK